MSSAASHVVRNNLFATWLSKVTTKNADLSKEPIRFYFRIIFVYGTALNSRFRLTTRFHKMSPKSQGCNVKPLVVQNIDEKNEIQAF